MRWSLNRYCNHAVFPFFITIKRSKGYIIFKPCFLFTRLTSKHAKNWISLDFHGGAGAALMTWMTIKNFTSKLHESQQQNNVTSDSEKKHGLFALATQRICSLYHDTNASDAARNAHLKWLTHRCGVVECGWRWLLPNTIHPRKHNNKATWQQRKYEEIEENRSISCILLIRDHWK